ILILIISAIMSILALQMIGIRSFSKIKIALPKSLTLKMANKKMDDKFSPFIIGFLTFFLPCGFTLIAQSIAILSGNPITASAIMLSFALGTLIPLLSIGLLSTKLLYSSLSDKFIKVTGFLILFFVIYNLNTQFNFGSLLPMQTNSDASREININKNNVQIISATYTNHGDIQPNIFIVKQNQPVRFEIDVKETGYGCMSTIIVVGLYNDPQRLLAGSKIVMEFTPNKVGDYTIACAMGVPRGTIKVIK
ncbi:MAG: sulfite exporter TauE/SafE family protein, partial [Minisyncoccota bacterium]